MDDLYHFYKTHFTRFWSAEKKKKKKETNSIFLTNFQFTARLSVSLRDLLQLLAVNNSTAL